MTEREWQREGKKRRKVTKITQDFGKVFTFLNYILVSSFFVNEIAYLISSSLVFNAFGAVSS